MRDQQGNHDNETMGEFFNGIREARREEKHKYQETQMRGDLAWLYSFGFTITEHNGGGHLLILVPTERGPRAVDFWPETGKWKVREGKAQGRFVRNIIKYFRLGDGVRPAKFDEVK